MTKADLMLKVDCFNLKYTLECGQCFRWKNTEDDAYIGVIEDRVVKLKQVNNILYAWSSNKDNLEEKIANYLDLVTDYRALEEKISLIDNNIKKSLEYSSGIHILNQPLFETIISYIISANNNIKRISRSVDSLSKKFGKEIEFENEKYYLFPSIDELKLATMDDLLNCGVGFRARYIKKDVEKFYEDREFIESLSSLDTEAAFNKLSELMGVGPKVADCILLFSLKKGEVFPVDVWVKRIMEKLYFRENKSLKQIREYAKENFKEDAGIIQQHLFHNVREGNI